MKKESIAHLMQPSNLDRETLDSWENFKSKLDSAAPTDCAIIFPLFLLLNQLHNIELSSSSSQPKRINYGKYYQITLQLISSDNLLEDALYLSIKKNQTKTKANQEEWVLLEYDNPYAYIVDRLHWLNENEIKRHLVQMSNITIKNHILEYIKQELSESVSQAVGISDKLSKISTHTQEDSKENSICKITQSEDFKSLIRETKHIETQLLDGQAAHTEAIAKLKEMKLYFQNQFIKPLIIAYKTPRLKNDQAKHSHLEYDIKTTEVYLQILKYAENIYNTPNCVIADWLNTAVERQTNRNLKLSTQKYPRSFHSI